LKRSMCHKYFMARVKRIDIPHCLYHVLSRSNTGDLVFRDQTDHDKFLYYLSKYCEKFSCRVHSWCLMDTHFHLILESMNLPSLSELMHHLMTAYTVYFNRRHNRHGHLFQGRFKSYVVDKKSYLIALSRYIHLNPFHTVKENDPEKYEASSLKYYINGGEPDLLYSQEILSFFKGNRKKYAKFVRDGLDEEIKLDIVSQRYIGDEAFVIRMNKRLGYLKEPGSRASAASRKRKQLNMEAAQKKAGMILSKVSDFFKIKEKDILTKNRYSGNHGKARTVIIFLLSKYLPWSCSELASYTGLNNKSTIHYHLSKARNSNDIHEIIQKIEISLE
jgi:REP-associated tyrosine transposase